MKKSMMAISYVLDAIAFLGCSNSRKAELTHGDNAEMAVAEVTQIMEAGLRDQLDVLADSQFAAGRENLIAPGIF